MTAEEIIRAYWDAKAPAIVFRWTPEAAAKVSKTPEQAAELTQWRITGKHAHHHG